ncbi:MAG: beta-ketoacyl-ACP synthase II [Spirochaetales bacterium]|nr:beta-ketoacyl-ACP synthase II [Spirochaetales bacterium]
MEQKRVVITGMGTINPLAHNVNDTWSKIIKGQSGIDKITKFDASTFTCQIAGEVKDFDYKNHFSEEHIKIAKRMDPFVHYAAAAVKQALADSGLDPSQEPQRIGISIGSGIGGIFSQEENTANLINKGHRRVSPFYIPATIGNIASGFISMIHGIQGPNLSMQTACATANHSLATAFMIIRSGMADVMIAGGTEGTIIEISVAGFCNMRALSTKYNDTPQTASRPFDVDRDGFVMGEGAGVLIIEEYEHALKRGAPIVCELLAIGMSGDAYDLVIPEPDGKGAFFSMQMALQQAGINAGDINYINAHGTATPVGDTAEAKAIKRLLPNQDKVHVGSTKSMHGHLLGATAGLEAIICAMAVKENIVPPNINVFNQDPEIKLTCINTEPVEKEVKYALSNSFGFGGHNSTVVLGKI